VNYLDYTIIVIIVIFIIRGLLKGFIHEVFGLLGVLISLVLATKMMGRAAGWIAQFADIPATLNAVLGFVVVFFVVMLISQIIVHAAEKFVKWAFLGWADKLAGAVAGFAKGAIVASLLLIIVTAMPLMESLIPGKEQSRLFEPTRKFAPAVFNILAAFLPGSKSFYEEARDSVEGVSKSATGEQTKRFLDSLSEDDSRKQEN
jgi:membrane protein required for colicin V production